jgi:hypothetical protein
MFRASCLSVLHKTSPFPLLKRSLRNGGLARSKTSMNSLGAPLKLRLGGGFVHSVERRGSRQAPVDAPAIPMLG